MDIDSIHMVVKIVYQFHFGLLVIEERQEGVSITGTLFCCPKTESPYNLERARQEAELFVVSRTGGSDLAKSKKRPGHLDAVEQR